VMPCIVSRKKMRYSVSLVSMVYLRACRRVLCEARAHLPSHRSFVCSGCHGCAVIRRAVDEGRVGAVQHAPRQEMTEFRASFAEDRNQEGTFLGACVHP
jgi:hypothetical protein